MNQSTHTSSEYQYQNHHLSSSSSVLFSDFHHPSTASTSTSTSPTQVIHISSSTSTLNLQASEDFTLVAVDPKLDFGQSRIMENPTTTDVPSRSQNLSPITAISSVERPRSTRQSSKRALTEALRLAQEAVLLDSQNEDPIAAFRAYSRSVTLLGEVMDRVIRGDHEANRRAGRAQVELAREDEARRLKNIHDTYAERMRILAEMYEIQDELPPGVLQVEVRADHPIIRPAPANQPTYVQYSESSIHGNSSRTYSTSSDEGSSAPHTPTLSEQNFSSSESLRSAYAVNTLPSDRRQKVSSTSHDSSSTRSSYNTQSSSSNPVSRPRAVSVSTRTALSSDEAARSSTAHSTHIDSASGYDHSALEPRVSTGRQIHDTSSSREVTAQPLASSCFDLGVYQNPTTPRGASSINDELASPEATPRPGVQNSCHAPRYLPQSNGIQARPSILVNPTTADGSISQRRSKSSLGVHPLMSEVAKSGNPEAGSSPAVSSVTLSAKENRARAVSQPGARSPFITNYSAPTGSDKGIQFHSTHQVAAGATPNFKALHLSPLQTQLANTSTSVPSYRGNGHLPSLPTSPLPPPSPQDPMRKPYHLMELIRRTMTSRSGGYITRKLHVPFEVWSQGGAKLINLPEKIRTIEVLCSALEDLETASSEYCKAGIINGKLSAQMSSIPRVDMEKWLSKLDEWSVICENVVGSVGRKLGVGEGFAIKKSKTVTSWSSKFARSLDKFTSAKSLESPASYVNGLIKLFDRAQLLDEHNKALTLNSSCYTAQPIEFKLALESRFKQSSEFFATVVLTFVIRDLSLLLDKYAKKGGQWLTE